MRAGHKTPPCSGRLAEVEDAAAIHYFLHRRAQISWLGKSVSFIRAEIVTASVTGNLAQPSGEEAVQRGLRRIVAAHPMHAAARRCRGGADIQPLHGSRIGIGLDRRACEELPDILQARVDVA